MERSMGQAEDAPASVRRRRVLAGAAVGAVGGVLAAACGGAGSGGEASKSAKPVKLIWAIYNDPPYLDAQKQGAQRFTAQHPNVVFDLTAFDDNAKLITEWLAGAGSHVAMNYGTPLVESGRQGLVISLDKYLKSSAKEIPLDDFVSFQLEATRWPSVGRFGLPMYINAYTLFFNRALFQKKGIAPPDNTWDWSAYADGLARVTDRDQGIWGGVIVNTQLGMTKVHQNAADIIDPKDDTKCTIGSPGALEALQWIHDRLWKVAGWGQADVVAAGGFKNTLGMLAGGKLATIETGSGSLGSMAKGFPDAQNDWDIAPLPKGKQRAARASIDSWTIAKVTPDQEAAWELMTYLQTPDWIELFATVAGTQPARISMQDRFVALTRKAIPSLATKNLAALTAPLKEKYARPQAIFRKDDEAWKIIKEAWDSTMVKNEQPVASAFADAERRVNALLQG
jgi:multiple sugar transport system substrate-binding protein